MVSIAGPFRCGGLPKITGIVLGVPIRRIIVVWGLYWGHPLLGNYHVAVSVDGGLNRP